MIDFGNMKVDEEKYYSLKQILKDMVTEGKITQEKMNFTLKNLAIVNNIVDIDNLQLSNDSFERTITIIPAKSQISNITPLKEDISQREKAKGYISLTEIASKYNDERPNALIQQWILIGVTLDFLDTWEMDNNDQYYYLGFQQILEDKKMQETFRLTPRQWVRKTRAIGIVCEKGHTGDIYAHPTIACDFAAWLFPEVKIKLFESVELGEEFFNEI